MSHGHMMYGMYTHTPLVSRFSPIRHAPQVLLWGLAPGICTEAQMILIWILHWAPGLLASTSETEIRPWGRGGRSALSGTVWLERHRGVRGGAPCCCVHEASPGGQCDPRESVTKSRVGLCVGVDRPASLLRQWAQRTVCFTWWGLPCVCGWGSGRGYVGSKH